MEPYRHHLVDEVGERAGGLYTGRAGTHNDEVQRAVVNQLRIAIRVFEHGEHARAQALGVGERIQREGVLLRARGAEEVRPGAHREHEVVPREARSVGTRHRLGAGVDFGDGCHLHADTAPFAEDPAQRTRNVARSDLRGRDLVQHRLELVIVVLVDQRHAHFVLRELFAHATPAKPPPTTTTVAPERSMPAMFGYSPGLLCMIPPSTKIVVAVR